LETIIGKRGLSIMKNAAICGLCLQSLDQTFQADDRRAPGVLVGRRNRAALETLRDLGQCRWTDESQVHVDVLGAEEAARDPSPTARRVAITKTP
jgi:hypothetical protein